MKTKKKKKKYSLGTGKNGVVRNYIESPSETLVENDIAMAKAKEKAANNGLANGLDIFGNMALQYGMSMAGGSKGVGKGIGQGFGNIFGGEEQIMETGGKVKNNPGGDKKSIKILQKRLKELGLYEGKIDGVFGPNTQKAYESFEQSEGKQESGTVPLNIKSLFNDLTGSKNNVSRKSLSEDELNTLQTIVRKNLSEGRDSISYDDYNTDELPSAKGNKPKKEGSLSLYDKLTDPNYKLKTTIGRANIVTTPTDTLVVDSYDFNDAKKEKGSFDNYVKNLKENPSLYNAARGLGTNFGSGDGEGASVIINTNQGVQATPGPISSFINDMFGSEVDLGFAFGGKVPNGVNVEVEGDEVGQAPNGRLIDFKGPSHENGGIDVNLPEGTEIFSKRIKVKGKTMAERKMVREKKVMTLEKLLEKNGGNDLILKKTIERTKNNNELEQSKDQQLQDMVGAMKGMAQFAYGTGKDGIMKYATGGPIIDWNALLQSITQQGIPNMTGTSDDFHTGDPAVDYPSSKAPTLATEPFNKTASTPGIVPEEGEVKIPSGRNSNIPNFTGGDIVGLAGTVYSAFEPMNNTNANRAGDTPNINAFKDFGNDALDRIGEAKGYIASQRDNALEDLETSRVGVAKRNRNSARGVNTLRALDTASDMNINQAQGDIYDTFAKQMMSLVSQEAGFENQQDSAVMQGEQNRDLADRQDRDNYFTQMAQDIATKGKGIQTLGKMVNQNKLSNVKENSLKTISKNGFQIDTNGNVVDKNGVTMDLSKLRKIAKDNNMSLEEVYEAIKNQ